MSKLGQLTFEDGKSTRPVQHRKNTDASSSVDKRLRRSDARLRD